MHKRHATAEDFRTAETLIFKKSRPWRSISTSSSPMGQTAGPLANAHQKLLPCSHAFRISISKTPIINGGVLSVSNIGIPTNKSNCTAPRKTALSHRREELVPIPERFTRNRQPQAQSAKVAGSLRHVNDLHNQLSELATSNEQPEHTLAHSPSYRSAYGLPTRFTMVHPPAIYGPRRIASTMITLGMGILFTSTILSTQPTTPFSFTPSPLPSASFLLLSLFFGWA